MSTRHYRGLTWDHPRGYQSLRAAASRAEQECGVSITWDMQSLSGFESHPIEELCARYDLVILDHPHVGDAVAAACLKPLEEVFDAAFVAEVARDTVGPSMASYRIGGAHWAMPLDAAAQVMAAREDLISVPIPATWDDVCELSLKTGAVAMSLAGPHAFLSFLSLVVALGGRRDEGGTEDLISGAAGIAAFDLLSVLASRSPASVAGRDPIGILDHMAAQDDVLLCPLVFGYVNYAAPQSGAAIRFADAPLSVASGERGSTLGGTGIGVTRRCDPSEGLLRHLGWLMGGEAQRDFIPAHGGQPSRRSVWRDDAVNERWNGFYRGTIRTLEDAFVRPRYAGYVPFQNAASTLLREALAEGASGRAATGRLVALYRESRRPQPVRNP